MKSVAGEETTIAESIRRRMSCRLKSLIAAEISAITRYYDQLIQWEPLASDDLDLFSAIEAPRKTIARERAGLEDLASQEGQRAAVLLNFNMNHSRDIAEDLGAIKPKLHRNSRVVAVLCNPYYRWLYLAANLLGLRRSTIPETFITRLDLMNLCKISGFELVRLRPSGYFPFACLGLGDAINKIMPALPFLRWFAISTVAVLRPLVPEKRPPSLSVIVPARNERGTIAELLARLPSIGAEPMEIIFVEGGSSDGTWEEIQRLLPSFAAKFSASAIKQTGKGKADAVRAGMAAARGDVAAILDADLTMPPELLPRFYRAYAEGHADFVNGSRLVYPIERRAMRFLNRLGNIFFAKALSHVMSARIGDALCGTKLFSLHDYRRFEAWREHFGDFDPFGDFELLFPAAELGIGIVDVAVRYRDRVYGQTNIRRFADGMKLLGMTWQGFVRIKMGKLAGERRR